MVFKTAIYSLTVNFYWFPVRFATAGMLYFIYASFFKFFFNNVQSKARFCKAQDKLIFYFVIFFFNLSIRNLEIGVPKDMTKAKTFNLCNL